MSATELPTEVEYHHNILIEEWGDDYGYKIDLAQKVFHLGRNAFTKTPLDKVNISDGELLGDNIQVIKLLSEIGKKLDDYQKSHLREFTLSSFGGNQ